jgi:hypothetical protein
MKYKIVNFAYKLQKKEDKGEEKENRRESR